MAIDAHSTTAPAVQPGLLRTWAGAVPVPTPDLTAETVTTLTLFPEVGEKQLCALLARTSEQAATAQAIHTRRALEGALDHGTALLAALGLPRLMEPGFVPLDPAAIGDALDTAIATLDALDAPGADLEDDGDDEPWLGWIDGKPVLSDSHDDREAEDDDEPILGAPERHPACDPWTSGRNSTGRQTHWSDGRNDSANDGEAEAGYDLPEGDDELCGFRRCRPGGLARRAREPRPSARPRALGARWLLELLRRRVR